MPPPPPVAALSLCLPAPPASSFQSKWLILWVLSSGEGAGRPARGLTGSVSLLSLSLSTRLHDVLHSDKKLTLVFEFCDQVRTGRAGRGRGRGGPGSSTDGEGGGGSVGRPWLSVLCLPCSAVPLLLAFPLKLTGWPLGAKRACESWPSLLGAVALASPLLSGPSAGRCRLLPPSSLPGPEEIL